MSLDDNLRDLHEHRKAVEQEFALSQDDPVAQAELTRKELAKLGPQAVETLGMLLATGSSDSIKMKCAQFVVGTLLDTKSADPSSELEALVKRLQKHSSA